MDDKLLRGRLVTARNVHGSSTSASCVAAPQAPQAVPLPTSVDLRLSRDGSIQGSVTRSVQSSRVARRSSTTSRRTTRERSAPPDADVRTRPPPSATGPAATSSPIRGSREGSAGRPCSIFSRTSAISRGRSRRSPSTASRQETPSRPAAATSPAPATAPNEELEQTRHKGVHGDDTSASCSSRPRVFKAAASVSAEGIEDNEVDIEECEILRESPERSPDEAVHSAPASLSESLGEKINPSEKVPSEDQRPPRRENVEEEGKKEEHLSIDSGIGQDEVVTPKSQSAKSSARASEDQYAVERDVDRQPFPEGLRESSEIPRTPPPSICNETISSVAEPVEQEVSMETGYKSKGLFGDDTSFSCSARPVREHDLREGDGVGVGKEVTSIQETQDAQKDRTPRRPEDDEAVDASPASQLPPEHSVSPRSSIRSSKRDFDAGICLSQEEDDDVDEDQVAESSPVPHAIEDKKEVDASELEPTLQENARVVAGQFEEQSASKGELKVVESPQISDSTITSAQPMPPTNDELPVPEQLADGVEATQDPAQRSQPRSKGLLGEDTSLSCTATDVTSVGVLRNLRESEAPPLVQRMSKGLLAAEDPNASCTSLPPSGFQPTAASVSRVLTSKGLYGEDASASCVASSIHARTAGAVSSAENNAYAVESTATLTVSQEDVEQALLKRDDLPLPTGSFATETTKDLTSERVDPSYLHTPPSTELALKISMARGMLEQSAGPTVHPRTVDEPQGDAATTDSGISLSGELGPASATASGDPEATPERQASAEKTPTGSQEAAWEKGDSGQELSRSVGSVKPAEPVAQNERIYDEEPPETAKAASANGVSFHGDDALPSRKADGEDSDFLTGDEGDDQEVETDEQEAETDEQEADTDEQPKLKEKAGESDYATADEEEDDGVAMPAGGGDKQRLKPYDSECLKTFHETSTSQVAAEITAEGSQLPDIDLKEAPHTEGGIHLSADADEVHYRTVDDVPDEQVTNTDSEQFPCPPKELFVKNECLPILNQNVHPQSYRERGESHQTAAPPELLHSDGEEETICLDRTRAESRDSIGPRRRNVDMSGSICLDESDHGSGSISLGQSLHAPSIRQDDDQRTSVAGGSRYSTGHLLPPKERSSNSIKELSATRLTSLRSRASASQKHSVISARDVSGRPSTKSAAKSPSLTPRGSHMSPSPSLGESQKSHGKTATGEAPGGGPERRSVGSKTSSHQSKASRNSSAHVLKMNNAENKPDTSATALSSKASRRSSQIVRRDALLSSEPDQKEDKITDSLLAGSTGLSLKQSYRSECLPISRKEEKDLPDGVERETSVQSVGVTTQLRAMADESDATTDSEQPVLVTGSDQLKQPEERHLDVGLDDELHEDAVAVLPEEVSQVSEEVEITHEESGVSRHTAFSRGYPETPAPARDEQQAIQMMKLRSECLRDGDAGPPCGDVEPSMSSPDANLLASGVLESHPGDVTMDLERPPLSRGRSSSESGVGVQLANTEELRNFRAQEGAVTSEATPAINIIGELRSECLASHRGSAASIRKTPVHFLLASDGSSEDEMNRRSLFRRATPLPPLGVVDLKELRHKSSAAGSRSILEVSEASTDTDYPIAKPANAAFCTCDYGQAQRPLGTLGTLGTITQRQSLPDASAPRPYRMKRCSNCGEECIYPAARPLLTEDSVLDKDKRRRSVLARAIETCERELGPLNDTLQRLQEKVRAMQLPELSGLPRRSTSHHLPHSPASPKRLHSRSASSVLTGAPRSDVHPVAPSVPCPYCGLQLVPESALSPLARMYILLAQPRGSQRGSKPSTPPPGTEKEDHP